MTKTSTSRFVVRSADGRSREWTNLEYEAILHAVDMGDATVIDFEEGTIQKFVKGIVQ